MYKYKITKKLFFLVNIIAKSISSDLGLGVYNYRNYKDNKNELININHTRDFNSKVHCSNKESDQ